MQNRFKYRVFVEKYGYVENGEYRTKPLMCDVHSLHLGTNKAIVSCKWGNKSIKLGDKAHLMQCTGLKDKNDKLIYEGDIVKNIHGVFKVIFDDKYACFCLDNDELFGIFKELRCATNSFEIIGNIYENKELLNG